MLKYQVRVMNYIEAFNYVYNHTGYKNNKNFAIISIQEYPTEEMGIIYKPGGHLKASLNIHFSDITREKQSEDTMIKLISNEDALQIKSFVEELNDMDISELIIHCHAYGVSRSAAVAAAILKVFNNDDSEIFDSGNYTPNMYVYNKILEVFGMENKGETFLALQYD